MKGILPNVRTIVLLTAVFLSAAAIGAQTNGGSSRPYTSLYTYATGSYGRTGSAFFNHELFSDSGGTNMAGLFRIPFLPFLYVGPQAGWRNIAIQGQTGLNLGLLYGGISTAANWTIAQRLQLGASFDAGYFYTWLSDGESGANPRLAAKASASYFITPRFGLMLSGGVDVYLGLYAGWSVSFGPTFRFLSEALGARSARTVVKPKEPPKPVTPTSKPKLTPLKAVAPPSTLPSDVEITRTELVPIFPIFYKFFDDHPLGSVTIRNNTADPVTIRSVDFLIKQYMDNPKTCATNVALGPGQETTIDLYALFTNRVLEISEGTKVSANLTVTYARGTGGSTIDHVETARIYDRNALTWDDDRRAAAFVATKDPAVLKFSKNVVGMVAGTGSRVVNHNLLTAMAIHDALALYDLAYVVDPSTPYEQLSKEKSAVDYLQFPSQTLEFKAGDCDDLSILYASLLESVGIETAFITVPGHIFAAFSIDSPPDRVRKDFLHPDDFIFTKDKSWIPVEVTAVKDSFLDAWQTGAKEWRENSARQQANFYPMHEAWQLYEPVGFSASTTNIAVPAKDAVVSRYLQDVVKFVDGEIYPQVAQIQGQIQRNPGDVRYINKLGVLYARYGLDDRAVQQFSRILTSREYTPALINMGNVAFLSRDMTKALDYYTRAQKQAPNNPSVLLAVARVNHELENYGTAKVAYDRLKTIRPDLATQFAYLDLRGNEAARAAEISQTKELVLWDEER